MLKGPAWMALMQGITFPMQAVLGRVLVLLLGMFGFKLFPTFGFLVPLGFNEGPGQALTISKVWEGIGFADAATIGLTFAAVGYFCAFFIGCPWSIGASAAAGPPPAPGCFRGIFCRGF